MAFQRGLGRIYYVFNSSSKIQPPAVPYGVFAIRTGNALSQCRSIHTTFSTFDLMEFFDDKENWGQREVQVGRSWKIEELRIKSNSDLHKLWFVLLKEKNMLLTMQHEYNEKYIAFPNPERIDKVEESMENLEKVVRERNKAYYELETGETGERPTGEAINCFGLFYKYKMSEFPIEKKFNKKFLNDQKLYNVTSDHKFVSEFLRRLNEKKERIADSCRRKRYNEVCNFLKTFPNIDIEALKEKFPDIDVEKAKNDEKSRGHHSNV